MKITMKILLVLLTVSSISQAAIYENNLAQKTKNFQTLNHTLFDIQETESNDEDDTDWGLPVPRVPKVPYIECSMQDGDRSTLECNSTLSCPDTLEFSNAEGTMTVECEVKCEEVEDTGECDCELATGDVVADCE